MSSIRGLPAPGATDLDPDPKDDLIERAVPAPPKAQVEWALDGVDLSPQHRASGHAGDGLDQPTLLYAKTADSSSPEPIEGQPETIVITQTPEPEANSIPMPDTEGGTVS